MLVSPSILGCCDLVQRGGKGDGTADFAAGRGSIFRSTIRSTKMAILHDFGGFRRPLRVCKSLKILALQDVTAEVASSSLVVPARFQGT